MGKISTKELLDKFYSSEEVKGTSMELYRSNIDKPELYAYEKKIGKELIDMNVDELFGLVNEYAIAKYGVDVPYMTNHLSYDQLAVSFRRIFNFYSETVELIRNPWYDKRMKGTQAINELSKNKESFTFDNVRDIISKLHSSLEPDRADYVELLILLFYSGFKNAEEIVLLKENMIDHRNETVALPGRIVQLTDRCYNLLVRFHNQTEIQEHAKYVLVPWQSGYFNFIVRPDSVLDINNRPLKSMCDIINRLFSTHINKPFKTKINYSMLYWLGFYDFLFKKYGTETDKILTSKGDEEDIAKLATGAREYGVKYSNITHLKIKLKPFIKS
ncbi:MAG: hypothetical protein ACI4XP_01070 [Acutalibacteraceae bacterium]